MNYLVYAVAVLLLASVALFIKAALIDKRPQKTGLILSLLAIPLFMIYYNDRWPRQWGELHMRDALGWLSGIRNANPDFTSDFAPGALLAVVLLTHMTVLQRVAVRRRLQRVHDPIANFFALIMATILIGGTIVSMFALGWIGAIVVTVAFALVYLGALALIGALIEVFGALFKLFLVWLKRKVFMVATWITRVSSWVSSLSGRLVSRSWIEQIREDTAKQESIFVDEQDRQDRALYEAYLRDRARKRRALQKHGIPVGPEPEPYDALISGPLPPDAPKPPLELINPGAASAVTQTPAGQPPVVPTQPTPQSAE